MAPPSVQELVERNRKFAETSEPMPLINDLKAAKLEPTHIVVVVSCSDSRLIPEDFLGFGKKEVLVVRNGGGRIAPAIRDMIIFDAILGVTDVMIVHHTDCGLLHITDEQIRMKIKERAPKDKEIDVMEFGTFEDLEQSVKDDVKLLQDSPYFSKELRVHGYTFDIQSGKLQAVGS